MKRISCLFLVVAMVFSICGCKQTTNNENQINYTTAQMTNESDFSKEEFISDIQGYWITKLGSEYNDCCFFINFDRNHYTSGIYIGEFLNDGAVTQIKELENNKYEVTIHCSEENEYGLTSSNDFTFVLSSNDKFNQEMIMETENDVTYHLSYAGTTIEAMREAGDTLLKLNDNAKNSENSGIPSLTEKAPLIGENFSTLSKRTTYMYSEPSNGMLDSAIFRLVNVDDLDCYIPIHSDMTEIIGVKNNEVVVYAIAGFPSPSLVKTYLSDKALNIEPKKYQYSDGIYALVWKLSNGYMMIPAIPRDNKQFYNYQSMDRLIYVKDMSYLSYIK